MNPLACAVREICGDMGCLSKIVNKCGMWSLCKFSIVYWLKMRAADVL